MSDTATKKGIYEPFVSISLTTYNGKEFLRKQLDSLLAQTYTIFEIIISDDHSDEITTAILEEYAAKDRRVHWSKSPFSRGFIKNTENSINLCKGEIIFLCDQDDTWYPNRIQEHVNVYRDPSVQWVYNKYVLTDQNDKEIGYVTDTVPDYYSKERMKLLYYVWGSCIGAVQTSFRGPLLHSVMPIGNGAPAHDSWIQLAIYPSKCVFIDKVLQTYRQHGNQEVGWDKKLTKEQFMAREKQAIADNLAYLKELSKNTTIQLWKRLFFLGVYNMKLMRNFFYKVMKKEQKSVFAPKE